MSKTTAYSASMPPDATSFVLDRLEAVGGVLARIFLAAGSTYSLMSLMSALMISIAFLGLRRRRRHALSLKVLTRALFPGSIWTHRSTHADIGMFLLNTFVTATLIGWGLISASGVNHLVGALLRDTFGAVPAVLPGWLGMIILTVATFLAYDFGYWFDHWLKHRTACLWPFHRVHHTAEVLTPLTAARMHPIDSLIFANILALTVGTVQGVVQYLFSGAHVAQVSGTNVILVAFLYTIVHLQHSHIRIAFTGELGKWFLSPGHHHLHHSDDPAHYDCNFGSCLAVWDRLFGTLRLPEARQRLCFGSAGAEDVHSATGSLLHPFILAWRVIARPHRPSGLNASPVNPRA